MISGETADPDSGARCARQGQPRWWRGQAPR